MTDSPADLPNDVGLLQRYDRLLELTSEFVSTLELKTLLQLVVDAAKELTDSAAAALLLYNPQRNQLYFEAATEQLHSDDTLIAIPMENSIAGWVYQNKQPLVLDESSRDPRLFREIDIVTTFPATNIIGIPMLAKEKSIGVIEAVNKQNGGFNDQDQRVLEVLAAQAAIAIENSRLFRQSDMIAEMVHELRTPLSALSAAVHLLQRDEIEDLQRERIRLTIANEVQRLNELATNYLELSRLESGRVRFDKEPVHLEGLLRESFEILRPQSDQENIKLEIDVQQTLAPVQGDRNQLKRMLLNLITNAIKYNRAGGFVRAVLSRSGEGVEITIEDSGVGIPEDQISYLFDRYYRVPSPESRVGGTGLGLTIARRIAQNHGGNISVESEISKGSAFTVWLPSGIDS